MEPGLREPAEIRRMFGRISRKYDLFNSINSFGVHHRWRQEIVRWSGVTSECRVLDCATGTGDVAFAFERGDVLPKEIVGIDFCREMLDLAEEKKKRRGSRVSFQEADILCLPFPEDAFDIVSIAFGVRNIPDLTSALREMTRVTKPRGRILVLESGRPGNPLVRKFAGFHFRAFMTEVSGRLAGNREAYRYLEESTARFNLGEELHRAYEQTGCFSNIETRSLSLGLVYLYRLTVR